MICFEWLQRPENVLAGYLRWPDYRSKEWPNAIRIEHHKTGELVWHPLEETVGNVTIKFYQDAEAILAKLPRRGVPMILREVIAKIYPIKIRLADYIQLAASRRSYSACARRLDCRPRSHWMRADMAA